MATGTIKRFVTERGFGFIREDGAHADTFFHVSAASGGEPEIAVGARVEYDVEPTDRGPRAVNVRRLEGGG